MPDSIVGSGRDIYTANFVDYLPESLKRDTKIQAIAAAVTKEALSVSTEINNVLIYSRIDELPEDLIDILAYDMHVDWYDYSYPLPMKREIVKNSVKVHKRMGTKYAVETALKSVYKTAGVKEWFEYGGEPYWFKVTINIMHEGLTEKVVRDIWEKVYFYKNLRSHCAGVFCALKTTGTIRLKPYAAFGMILKVKAYLVHELSVEDNTTKLLPKAAVGGKLKVKTRLTGGIVARTDNEKSLSYQRAKNTIKVRKGR